MIRSLRENLKSNPLSTSWAAECDGADRDDPGTRIEQDQRNDDAALGYESANQMIK